MSTDARIRADNLNNQAVSLISLGKPPGAEQLLEKVLRIAPNHPEATYNRALLQWRHGRLTDVGLLRTLEELRGALPADWRPSFYLGLIHAERGDMEAAVAHLAKAIDLGGGTDAELAFQRFQRFAPMSARPIQLFGGATEAIRGVALSSDGRSAVTVGESGTLRRWDIATGASLAAIDANSEQEVRSITVASDARWAIAGGRSLTQWDLGGGGCLRRFEGHEGPVTAISSSANGEWLLSGSADRTVRLWDVATGKCVRLMQGHSAALSCVDLSPDGRFAMSGSEALELWLWDAGSGTRMRAFEIQQFPPECVSLSRDGRWVLSGDADAKLHLWSTKNGMRVRTLRGHAQKVTSVAMSADGRWAVSGSLDGTVRLWDLSTGCCVRTFEGHEREAVSVCLSLDGRWLLVGYASETPGRGALRLWDLSIFHQPSGRFIAPPARCAVEVKREARPGLTRFQGLLAEARKMADAGRGEEAMYLIDQARRIPGFGLNAEVIELRNVVGRRGTRERFRDGRCVQMLRSPGAVGPVAISPDATHALSSGPDKIIRLWDLKKGELQGELPGHRSAVNDLCFTPDGQRALSAGEDGVVCLWDLASASCQRSFAGHVGWVSSVAASPDGRWALSGGRDKTLRLWDLATGACLRTFSGHENLVRCVRFGPCGRWALSASFDKTLRLWEVASGRCLRVFAGHADIIHAAAVGWQCRLAVSAGNEKTVRVWDLKTGQCLRVFQDHFERVLAVAMTGDDRWAVSGSGDKLLRLWNLANGQCVQVLSGHTAAITSLGLSPDGRWLVSGSHDQTVRVWELEWDYDFPAPSDWDDGAAVYLENFLALHTPFQAELPAGREPTDDEVARALTRAGTPAWSEENFQQLLHTLGAVGYGWLRPDGVRKKLEEMARRAAPGGDR